MTNDNDELRDHQQNPLSYLEETIEDRNTVNMAQALASEDPSAGEQRDNRTQIPVPELGEADVKEAAKVLSADEEDNTAGTEKLAIIDDPYIAGQCTTRVTLVISPEDGHDQGPLVFITASTHDDLPDAFLTFRLKDLALPSQIVDAIALAHGTLIQRGEEKETARQLAGQQKHEAEQKEQQRKQKKQALAKKETEKKKAEEKQANEPQIMDMFAALA